jgi:hypothetical protein
MTMDMHYSNDFYVEYTKDYSTMDTKVRHIVCKSLKSVLYFDKGYWDSATFMPDKISAIKKLPASYFRTLQMSFFTQNLGQNFSMNSIEFGKIKTKL